MRETLLQHTGLAWAVLCGALGLLLLIVLATRRWRRGRAGAEVARALAPDRAPEGVEEDFLAPLRAPAVADAAEILLALQDAEKSGAREKLPALYLGLARCRVAAGEADEAAELLRRSIRAAAGAGHKQTHAEARVVLGDIAHAHGDATTACEHWQIARALFHELKRPREHSDVETRMLKNGCPTDWVLTDF